MLDGSYGVMMMTMMTMSERRTACLVGSILVEFVLYVVGASVEWSSH
jgi:hypothetical protein